LRDEPQDHARTLCAAADKLTNPDQLNGNIGGQRDIIGRLALENRSRERGAARASERQSLPCRTVTGRRHDTRATHDWLGHRSIQHTTRYTQLSAAPFKDFWR